MIEGYKSNNSLLLLQCVANPSLAMRDSTSVFKLKQHKGQVFFLHKILNISQKGKHEPVVFSWMNDSKKYRYRNHINIAYILYP